MHALLHCRKPGRHNSLRLTSGTGTGETRETRSSGGFVVQWLVRFCVVVKDLV
jgi:hypothetical protein